MDSEVGSVMCSYNAINWVPVSISTMIGSVLRRRLKFDGFVISDYDELRQLIGQQLPTSFQSFNDVNETTCQVINSGVDMMMVSNHREVQQYSESIKTGVKSGMITMDRLNDAVARILSVKLALGIAKLKTPSDDTPR
jgi:beta-glucosidase